MSPQELCKCGLDLTGVVDHLPKINVECYHDGNIGLTIKDGEPALRVAPGQNLEVKWRLSFPEDGAPPRIYQIGWDNGYRGISQDDRSGTNPGGDTGNGALPGTGEGADLHALTSEAASTSLTSSIPDGFEPLVGYRGWQVTKDEKLKSTAYDHVWSHDKPEVAVCQQQKEGHHVSYDLFLMRQELEKETDPLAREDKIAAIDRLIHEARRSPERNCSCGVYAVLNLKDVGSRTGNAPGLVYGRIHAWGKIAEYSEGFRSEVAKIDMLFLPKNPFRRAKVRRIARTYGAKVESFPRDVDTPTDKFPISLALFISGAVIFGSFLGTISFTTYLLGIGAYCLLTLGGTKLIRELQEGGRFSKVGRWVKRHFGKKLS